MSLRILDNTVKNKLSDMKRSMSEFFTCDATFIKFSDPLNSDDSFIIKTEIVLLNREKSTTTRLYTSTYIFEFNIEYSNTAGVIYEGNYYSFDNIRPFFIYIANEIAKLNDK